MSVRCPPDRSRIPLSFVPGGCATISIPLSRTSSDWTSSMSARPPPKSVWNVYSKFFLICSKVTWNCFCEVWLISSIAAMSSTRARVRSSLWFFMKSWRCLSFFSDGGAGAGRADESACAFCERQCARVRDAAQHLYGVHRACAGGAVSDPFQVRAASWVSHPPCAFVFAPKAWCALERDSELTQAYLVEEED